jgi:TonB-dependent receptor
MMHVRLDAFPRPRVLAWASPLLLVILGLAVLVARPAQAAPVTGRVQGRIVATDTGEPLGYADLRLVPSDTTLRRVGGMTNADGTFLLEAAPGRYALEIRAMSYARKRVEGLAIEAGKLLPFSTGLHPEALLQEEIVVEARVRQNTEAAMLTARKRAAAVGDAVSAEQVRRSPDRDAAEVLRRVTGLSVSDGKYVFVRGLGERYSSTEVDGVRIASPEQNKRVVPLDLLPANLLDNIVVQKTYTSDRPAEFGGGDVQVRTKDFPGKRTWSFAVGRGYAEGVTARDRRTYHAPGADLFGFSAAGRGMPAALQGVSLPLLTPGTRGMLASLGRTFGRSLGTTSDRTDPNSNYSLTYGDELKLFGRELGVIQSWSLSHGYDRQEESQRLFRSDRDTLYDYAVTRWTETVQLGGLAGLSYRLSPRHSLHVRGLYSNTAEDEVRLYEGADHNSTDISGAWLVRRNTRLTYVERALSSGSAEGRHEFPGLLGANLDWKLGRSHARRQQPDRREYTYDRNYWFDGDTAHWVMQGVAHRDFGDLTDDGRGITASATVPYRLGALGSGRLMFGYDRQTKHRDNVYRRFNVYANRALDTEAPVDSVFSPYAFDSSSTTAYIQDVTYNLPMVGLDNYRADQRITAGYLSVDAPLGRHLRANLGVRVEDGFQDVESHALFAPGVVLQRGRLQNTDVLPSGNLTWSVTNSMNLRLAASRTISRPDLNELSPSPFIEYIGGAQVLGNPELRRARLDNLDVRLEVFPGLSEVLAVGYFHKQLHDPIEQVYVGGSPMLLIPRNSDHGRNSGVEIEARLGLGRIVRALAPFALNSNASFISSRVTLPPSVSRLGSQEHPLQGQADYLVNASLSWASVRGVDASVMFNAVGKRLSALGVNPLPDVYAQPTRTLDAAANVSLLRALRVKLSAKNLLDPRYRWLQGGREVSSYRAGRSYSVAFSVGS